MNTNEERVIYIIDLIEYKSGALDPSSDNISTNEKTKFSICKQIILFRNL